MDWNTQWAGSARGVQAAPRVRSNRGLPGCAWVCLTVGQIVSVAGCVASLCPAVWAVCVLCGLLPDGKRPTSPDQQPPPLPQIASYSGWVVVGGVLGFFYSAGMYFVFDRAKRGSP